MLVPATSEPGGSALPTPLARDAKGPNGFGKLDCLPTVVELLSTPTTSDQNGAGSHGDGGSDLRTTVGQLLPTPAAQRSGRNRSQSDGAAVRWSLDSIDKLLPTPTTQDMAGPHKNRPDNHDSGMELRTAIWLLPTPTASEGERASATYARGNPTLLGALTSVRTPPRSNGGNEPSDDERRHPTTTPAA